MEEVIRLEAIIRAALPAALKSLNSPEGLTAPVSTYVIDAECIMLGLQTTLKGTRLDRLRILAKQMEQFRS